MTDDKKKLTVLPGGVNTLGPPERHLDSSWVVRSAAEE